MEIVAVVFTSISNSKSERWRLPPTSPPEKEELKRKSLSLFEF